MFDDKGDCRRIWFVGEDPVVVVVVEVAGVATTVVVVVVEPSLCKWWKMSGR